MGWLVYVWRWWLRDTLLSIQSFYQSLFLSLSSFMPYCLSSMNCVQNFQRCPVFRSAGFDLQTSWMLVRKSVQLHKMENFNQCALLYASFQKFYVCRTWETSAQTAVQNSFALMWKITVCGIFVRWKCIFLHVCFFNWRIKMNCDSFRGKKKYSFLGFFKRHGLKVSYFFFFSSWPQLSSC